MQITFQLLGMQQTLRRVADLPRQMRYAGARALNDAAFKARADWVAEMTRVFDRPTPFITKSIWVGKPATPDSLSVWIYPRDPGGKSVDPEKVLLAEVFGGVRRPKRFELAFRQAGILPQNMAMVPASWALADPSIGDGYGGVKGSFLVRLISYLQAFGEVGYRANMSARNRTKLSGKGRWINGRFYAATTKRGASGKGAAAVRRGGTEYFISRGRGEFAGRGSWKNGQQQHLRAGIWQRTGLYGADVKPVFLFTRMPRYGVRLDLRAIEERAGAVHLPQAWGVQIKRALESAKETAQ